MRIGWIFRRNASAQKFRESFSGWCWWGRCTGSSWPPWCSPPLSISSSTSWSRTWRADRWKWWAKKTFLGLDSFFNRILFSGSFAKVETFLGLDSFLTLIFRCSRRLRSSIREEWPKRWERCLTHCLRWVFPPWFHLPNNYQRIYTVKILLTIKIEIYHVTQVIIDEPKAPSAPRHGSDSSGFGSGKGEPSKVFVWQMTFSMILTPFLMSQM